MSRSDSEPHPRRGALLLVGVSILVGAGALHAQQSRDSFWRRERLTGGWTGARADLEEAGLTFGGFYLIDVLTNVRGGRDRGAALLGNVDLQLTAELGPLLGWQGARAFAYGLANHGDSFSEKVGDLQVVSNIEAPETVRLYEAWVEQQLADDTVSVLVGLYDLNSEFDVIPAATLFVNSSQGMGAEFGNSGRNGPSVFPVASLAARVNWRPHDAFYLRAMVADGVPGNPDDPRSSRVSLDADDGVLLAAEAGYLQLPEAESLGGTRARADDLAPEERQFGSFGKYAVGIWGYTTGFGANERQGGIGVYALAEQHVFAEADDPYQGLIVFARAGVADDRLGPFEGYLGAGLNYRGPLPARPDDSVGFAVAAGRLSDPVRAAIGADAEEWEVALELTWLVQIAPWLAVQPDVQYVIHPGGDPSLDDAWVLGLRGTLAF